MWHKINQSLYNPHLTYEQNQMNGCDLPQEGYPVLIYDSDKPRYLVGTIGTTLDNPERLVVYESVHGDIYGGVDYIYWQEINYYTGLREMIYKLLSLERMNNVE